MSKDNSYVFGYAPLKEEGVSSYFIYDQQPRFWTVPTGNLTPMVVSVNVSCTGQSNSYGFEGLRDLPVLPRFAPKFRFDDWFLERPPEEWKLVRDTTPKAGWAE